MVVSITNKGIFYWTHRGHNACITLSIDDISFDDSDISRFKKMAATFDQYFPYTTASISLLHFLNYQIIQSVHGNSDNPNSNIPKNNLNIFFIIKQTQ